MKKMIVLSFGVLSFMGTTLARDTFDPCGLGWSVTDKKTMSATSTRGTTNATVHPTFGMTSGTMGCDKFEGFAANEIQNAQYVASNYDMIRTELALGSGEFASAALTNADTLSCGQEKVLNYVQENFEQVVTSAKDGVELYKNLKAASNQACS